MILLRFLFFGNVLLGILGYWIFLKKENGFDLAWLVKQLLPNSNVIVRTDTIDLVCKFYNSGADEFILKGEGTSKLKDRIVKRTKLGQGVDIQSRNTTRLDQLSTGYKKTRKTKQTSLDRTTRPAKANNTATGQLLRSLTTVKVKLNTGVKWVIKLGDRRGRNLDGKSSRIGNKKLNEFLEKQGRSWFGFTKPQINKITQEIRQIIIKFLE
mgnify:CR=1 FL=1